jgi:hypothetical protein
MTASLGTTMSLISKVDSAGCNSNSESAGDFLGEFTADYCARGGVKDPDRPVNTVRSRSNGPVCAACGGVRVGALWPDRGCQCRDAV